MNFKKFMTVATLSVIALSTLSIVACTQQPESSFKKNLDLGYYEGMHVNWVKDDADTAGTGFYVIDDAHIDNTKLSNKDFDSEKFVGNYGDLKILWVKDRSEADSKGFYLFKNSDNQIVPSLSVGEKFQSGKSHTTKNVGTVFTSSLNNPALHVKLDDKPYQEEVTVSELSSAQLIELSQRLLDIAKQKQLDNTNTNTVSRKPKF